MSDECGPGRTPRSVTLSARTEHIKNHMLDSHGKRDFTATVPGTRLVGDITYLKTGSGWLYVATVIDLATRMVVGWSMDSNMRTPLVINALAMARDHGCLHPEGAIFTPIEDRNTPPSSSRHGAPATRSPNPWD